MADDPAPKEPSRGLEAAIVAWRAEIQEQESLRANDIDELESHLRDELDALAAVGLHGAEAFAIATSKLGAPGALGAEFARSNVLLVWRRPALLMLVGALLSLVGPGLGAVAESIGLVTATALRLGAQAGSFVQVVAVLMPRLVGIALVIGGAHGLAPVPSSAPRALWSRSFAVLLQAAPALRVAIVVGVGLFVLASDFALLPHSLGSLDPERRRVLNVWYAVTAPTYRLMWRATPFVLAFGMRFFRTRAAGGGHDDRARFWVLSGILAQDFCGKLAAALSRVTVLSSWAVGASPSTSARVDSVVTVCLPLIVVGLAIVVWRRLPPPATIVGSSATSWLALSLALGCLACSQILVTWPGTFFAYARLEREQAYSMHASVVAAMDVIAPALAAALALRLRSRLDSREAAIDR